MSELKDKIVNLEDLKEGINAVCIKQIPGISNFWQGTKEQYDAIAVKDPKTMYYITNDTTMTEYYTKTETEELLAAKQNKLTDAQISAVNSGIDDTKVTQIGTNETNIATNTTDIATIQGQITTLTSAISVKVAETLPATPTTNTLYFIGTTSPFHKYLIDSAGTQHDLGTGEVDLSQYYKKTETNNLLNAKLSLSGGTMTGAVTFAGVRNLYQVGDVFETLNTSTTAANLASRFGGGWTQIANRYEWDMTENATIPTYDGDVFSSAIQRIYTRTVNGLIIIAIRDMTLKYEAVPSVYPLIMPDGYRPTQAITIYGCDWGNASSAITVETDGRMRINGATNKTGWGGIITYQLSNSTAQRTFVRFRRTS